VFADSLLGKAVSPLWGSPIAAAATAAGLGAAAFAGATTFAGSDGDLGERADASAGSATTYGLLTGGLVAGTGAALAATGYAKGFRGGLTGAAGFGAGSAVGTIPNLGRNVAGNASNYAAGLMKEIKSPGGWKTALMRPTVSGGLGALVGGVIGSQVSDDPTTGAIEGAALGTGFGIAAGRAAKAATVWSKWGGAKKSGAIIAGSVALGMLLRTNSPTDYGSVDQAQPEDNGYSSYQNSGVSSRMTTIAAKGDLVFGLHNSR
jgi:hypothetical protein